MDRRLDPPHGVGRQAESAIGVEALDRLRHADVAFANQLAHRQAVAAVAHRDLGDQPEMAGDQLVRGLGIAVLAPAPGQLEFLVRLQHREFLDLPQVTGEVAVRIESGRAMAHRGGCVHV